MIIKCCTKYQIIIYLTLGKVAPSSIKLEPMFLTKEQRLESENINSKTKAEIMLIMKDMDLEAIEIFVAEDIEVGYKLFN